MATTKRAVSSTESTTKAGKIRKSIPPPYFTPGTRLSVDLEPLFKISLHVTRDLAVTSPTAPEFNLSRWSKTLAWTQFLALELSPGNVC